MKTRFEIRDSGFGIFAAAVFVATTALAQPHPITFDDLAAIRRIGAPQVSPDGKWIAYDASNVDVAANYRHSAIYLMPSAGGESAKISDGVKQDEGPAWSPDGKTIAYVSNREGGAKQVYLFDVAAGTTRKLTSLAGGAGSVKWMPDGAGLVLVSDIYPDCGVDPQCIKDKTSAAESQPSKGRVITSLLYRHCTAWQDPTRSHVLFVPLDATAPRDLTPGAFDAPPFSIGGGDEFDVSPDGKELVFARNTDVHPEVSTNSDLFLVPISGGEPRRITTRQGADTSPKYSPDGKWIAYRSQRTPGYESDLWELWLYNRATGAQTRVAEPFPNWIESFAWSPDSRSIYFVADEAGNEPIFELNLGTKNITRLFANGSAGALAVSRDGQRLYFDLSTLQRPNEIFVLSKIPGATRAEKLTRENDVLFANINPGAVQDFHWTGADNTPIQGWIVTRPGFDPSKKWPAIVLIHGGTQGAWNNGWTYRWNALMFASRGYVLLMPNPRGSTCFGQQFVAQISGDWGGRPYVDIMNGVDAFSALPYVDASRVGAAGASYGGYMIDWLLGHTDRFRALVSHDGVYNLTSEYGTTEELWFPE